MFLASAINTRFLLPQFQIISKTDLLDENEAEEIASWAEDSYMLEMAIDARLTGINRIISQDMMDVIGRLGLEFAPVPVSSATNEGFNDLYAQLMLAFTDRYYSACATRAGLQGWGRPSRIGIYANAILSTLSARWADRVIRRTTSNFESFLTGRATAAPPGTQG